MRAAGVAAQRRGFFWKSAGRRGATTGPQAIDCSEWQTRTVGRSSTGTWWRSESSKARATMSRASCGLAGSSAGILANSANRRESCSVCEECRPGSSATISSRPPATPM
jgi:hypothetical protein